MRWLPVAVIVAGWAWAGFTNAPRMSDPQAGAFGIAIGVSCLMCWWIGRRSGRAAAYAVATAHAEARAAAVARSQSASTAQAAVVVNVGEGARAVASRDLGGLDAAPWIGEPIAAIEQDTYQMSAEESIGTYDSQGSEHRA